MENTVARLLTAEGALVEPVSPDGLSIVASPEVQAALGIPEWSCIGFGAELPPNAKRVTLESDWLERLSHLLDRRGKLCSLSIPKREFQATLRDPETVAAHEIVLENAVYRIMGTTEAMTRYLLVVFHFTAVSDEKREELLTFCVNESNGACAEHLHEPLLSDVARFARTDLANHVEPPQSLALSRLAPMFDQALKTRTRLQLAPFLTGMERRMTRDMERLHTYHSDLRKEAFARLEEKIKKDELEESRQREKLRMTAIEREFLSKVNDLQRKYALSVKIEPIQALRIVLPVTRLGLTFMRRKGTRAYHLDWNPISKKLDNLPCEGCYSPSASRLLCDAKLHFLCRNCLSECPSCHKSFCRACHASGCPSCSGSDRQLRSGIVLTPVNVE